MGNLWSEMADEIRARYSELGRRARSGELTSAEKAEYVLLTDWAKDLKTQEKHSVWYKDFYKPKFVEELDKAQEDGLTEKQANNRATQRAVAFTAQQVGCTERNVRKAFHLRKANTVEAIIAKKFS